MISPPIDGQLLTAIAKKNSHPVFGQPFNCYTFSASATVSDPLMVIFGFGGLFGFIKAVYATFLYRANLFVVRVLGPGVADSQDAAAAI
ncbi:MAG TPA: hypothetical protein VFI27_08540 [candidate division Zixibacteria bacterium]|nr:hypothetical protein [candidate division Zixibacteria bacterium]